MDLRASRRPQTALRRGRHAGSSSAAGASGSPMARDVTTLHETQDHLIERHQILHEALENCLDGLSAYEAIRDSAGRIIDFQCILANPAALQAGPGAGGLAPRHAAGVLPRARRRTARSPAWSTRWRRARRSATSGAATCRRASSGCTSPSPSCATACCSPSPTSPPASARSASSTKAAAQQVSILHNSIDGIIAFSAVRNETGEIRDLRFDHINPAAEKLLQEDANDLLGRYIIATYPQMGEDGLLDKLRPVIETGEPIEFEFLLHALGPAALVPRGRLQAGRRRGHQLRRHHLAQDGRAGHAEGEGGRRAGRPLQERLPRHDQPRAAHAHERRHRLHQPAARHRADAHAARLHPDHPGQQQRAPRPHRRHPRLLQDRGRQARAGDPSLRRPPLPARRHRAADPAGHHQGPGAGRDDRPQRARR